MFSLKHQVQEKQVTKLDYRVRNSMEQLLPTALHFGITCMVQPLARSICTKWLVTLKHSSGLYQEIRESHGLMDKCQLEIKQHTR